MSIKVLDCTLRDGGYVNNWQFGRNKIHNIIDSLQKTGIDIIELGFLNNSDYDEDRTIFSRMDDLKINLLKNEQTYSFMIEATNKPLYVFEEIPRDNAIIRVVVWKRLLDKGYEYCKQLAENGFRVFIQPARVEQYSDEEFVSMLNLFKTINPEAIYIVDSFGTMYSNQIKHYALIADKILPTNIAIGYHGHDNLLQAIGNAIDFLEIESNRDIIIDASMFGMGRGAGNLKTELIVNYLNGYRNKMYDMRELLDCIQREIIPLSNQYVWGYSIENMLTASFHSNPNYATSIKNSKINYRDAFDILDKLPEVDRVKYSELIFCDNVEL